VKPNLKLILEVDGKRIGLTMEEARELAEKLQVLVPPPPAWYPVYPTYPPYFWHVTWTGTGTNAAKILPLSREPEEQVLWNPPDTVTDEVALLV